MSGEGRARRVQREGQDPGGSHLSYVTERFERVGAVASSALDRSPALENDVESDSGGPGLVFALYQELEAAGIRYCHWKSNEAFELSPVPEDDLDLLVSRSDTQRFEEILSRMGFKSAQLPSWREVPGVWHAYGLDKRSGRLVHVHAHYQLAVGDDMTKNYRLPIEEPYLASAALRGDIRIPAPEFEFAVFLVRMVLKHCSWDALVSLQGALSPSEQRELTYLLERIDLEQVWAITRMHLPFLPQELWESCLHSIRPESSIWFRIKTARELQHGLDACSRRAQVADTCLKLSRRYRTLARRRLLSRGPVTPARLSAAGVLIAIVGGDGAGKSTAVEDVSTWLGSHLSTVALHLGKPHRSATSALIKKLMGAAASVGPASTSSSIALRTSLAASNGKPMGPRTYARLAWEVLTARDRYRNYRRARRLSSNGAIVVCDRYPLPEIKRMDGAVTAHIADESRQGRLFRYLAELERGFYDRITYPDLLIVLRVDPDVAVQRRSGQQDESILRPRSEEIWQMEWGRSRAVVIDAGKPKEQMLSEIRSVIWSRL